MEQTLGVLAQRLNGQIIGDDTMCIRGINTLEAVQAGELAFVEDVRYLAQAIASNASAVLVPFAITQLNGKSGIRVPHPNLAFAQLLDWFYPSFSLALGVHPSAVIGANVQVGASVFIGPHAVIGNQASVGQRTIVESGVHVGHGVTIGDDCLIGPNVVIYDRTQIGHRVRIHGGSVIGGDGFGYVFHEGRHVKVPQVGNVIIEDDVEIGCNVCVDRATLGSTMIRRGTKIDNLVQIAHNNHIGSHVIIAGQVGFSGSVRVGDYSMFGGKAGVVDHVTIGDHVQVGAASVVTKSVPPGEIVWGFPAKPIRSAKHEMASLARLPTLLKRIVALTGRFRAAEERLGRLERSESL